VQTVDLSGETAVVTGASSGIGRAIAERLGAAGATVYLCGRSAEPMGESMARIERDGGHATTAVLDVRDIEALQAFVTQAEEDTGRLDVMVNNAGVSFPGSIVDADPDHWRVMLETNVLALLAGCQAAVRAMRRTGTEGHVVNISSVAGLTPDSGVYGATKHAVNVISNTLRNELEDDTIRVVNVMPGAVATNFARTMDPEVLRGIAAMVGLEAELTPGEKIPDEVLEAAQRSLEQFLAAPEDVADAVLYAVSQPIRVNVSEVVVRPPKRLSL
jgi:NADP-dependent 3-hydroxy acid dehydrogenase YdfG